MGQSKSQLLARAFRDFGEMFMAHQTEGLGFAPVLGKERKA